MNRLPQFLCIGHCCHDLHHSGYLLGGAASYCSLFANNIGYKSAIVTSYGPEFQFAAQFKNAVIPVHVVEAEQTTLFENKYEQGQRVQLLHQRAETIYSHDIPESWTSSPLVKFCLIADEADYALLDAFPDSFVGATIQGWLRSWNANGQVFSKRMDWNLLSKVDVVIFSEEDIQGFEEDIPLIAGKCDLVIMTCGAEGATVFHKATPKHYPAFLTTVKDTTGAGDVFGTAFLLHYYKYRLIPEAMAFAHAAASLSIEGDGVHLPELKAIEIRMRQYKKRYWE